MGVEAEAEAEVCVHGTAGKKKQRYGKDGESNGGVAVGKGKGRQVG